MRVRALDDNGDMTFGKGAVNFLVDTPQTVAQVVATRLKLQQGEWFADTTDGTPWNAQVLGRYTQGTRDLVVKSRVLAAPGVNGYSGYASTLTAARTWSVQMVLDTIYGHIELAGPV